MAGTAFDEEKGGFDPEYRFAPDVSPATQVAASPDPPLLLVSGTLFDPEHTSWYDPEWRFGPEVTPALITASPSSITTAEAFGSATLTPGVVTASPSGIVTAYASGSALFTVNITPSGIVTAYASGAPTLTPGVVFVSPSGIVTAQAFGAPAVVPGPRHLHEPGIGRWCLSRRHGAWVPFLSCCPCPRHYSDSLDTVKTDSKYYLFHIAQDDV